MTSRPLHLQEPFEAKHAILAVLIVVLGFALRLQSAGGDLWQDEIWSINLAQTMNAWHEAFWLLIHDNNHPLNTLYLYLAGPDKEPWQYRLGTVAGGTLSIIAAGWAIARGGPGRILMAMLLTAVLYPLVHFGSEARGYGIMLLFSFIAFGAVDRAESETSPYRWLFALAVGLGALSHLSILPIVFSMTVAFLFRAIFQGDSLLVSIHKTLRFSAPSAGVLGLIGGLFIYGAQFNVGKSWFGGRAWICPEQGCFVGAWDDIVLHSLGGFGADNPALHSGLFLIFVIGGLLWLFMRSNPRALLYLGIWGFVTLIYIALKQPDVPFARYVLPIFAFLPLFVADIGAELRRSSRTAAAVFGVAVFAFIAANAWSVTEFQKDRRGQYQQAYDLITRDAARSHIVLATDQTYRLQTVIDYLNLKTPERTFEYVWTKKLPATPPKWMVQVTRYKSEPMQNYCFETANYQLVESFEYWGLAGAHWDVYRLATERADSCEEQIVYPADHRS